MYQLETIMAFACPILKRSQYLCSLHHAYRYGPIQQHPKYSVSIETNFLEIQLKIHWCRFIIWSAQISEKTFLFSLSVLFSCVRLFVLFSCSACACYRNTNGNCISRMWNRFWFRFWFGTPFLFSMKIDRMASFHPFSCAPSEWILVVVLDLDGIFCKRFFIYVWLLYAVGNDIESTWKINILSNNMRILFKFWLPTPQPAHLPSVAHVHSNYGFVFKTWHF